MDKALLAALPRAKKPVKAVEGIDSILYGDPKCGKTSTLDDPNMRIQLLDLEGGTSVLAGAENVDIVPIETLEQLNAYGELIKDGKKINENGEIVPYDYGMTAIDSITRLQDLVKDYVVRVVAPNRQREIKDTNLEPRQRFGSQSDWGNFGTIIADTVKFFHTLTKRGEKSINVMWIAHRDNRVAKVNGIETIEGTIIKMQGSYVSEVMSVVDALFYMDKVMGKDNKLHYCIRTQRMGIYEAGVRQSKREEKLDPVIDGPVWSDIFKQLGYSTVSPYVKNEL